MRIKVPNYVKYIMSILDNNNKEVYIIGGSVRDYFLGVKPHDYDLATNALPNESYSIYKNIPDIKITTLGLIHGSIKVWYKDYEAIDITTYGYNPLYMNKDELDTDIYSYVPNIYDDLSERDFTMNSMAYNPLNDTLLDPYDGVSDIENRQLRFINNPDFQIERDPFLILRAFRQAISLNLKIDKDTLDSLLITDHLKLLYNVSGWRRGNELLKIMSVDYNNSSNFSKKLLELFLMHIFRYVSGYIIDYNKYYNFILSNNDYSVRINKIFENLNDSEFDYLVNNTFEYDNDVANKILNIRNLSEYIEL